MFDRQSDFFKLSKGVVERFLQSAVIVDDGAAFHRVPPDKPPSQLITPGRGLQRQADIEDLVRPASEDTKVTGGNGDVGRLDAKKVIDSFARRGIVCSVVLPSKEEMEELADTLERLASCADIIVLDWTLYKDAGKTALEMIERIVRSSIGSPEQLRLIVIYTINPQIVSISQQIKTILLSIAETSIGKGGSTAVEEEDDGLTLTFGPSRITVLAKRDFGIPKEYDRQIVSFEKLADRVSEEFTVMTAGLVSNVVLEAMAQVRRNTHRILGQFSVDLDAPYLTHRALLKHPDEAEDHLTTLAAEELQAILEEARVGGQAASKSIHDWLKAKEEAGKPFTLRWYKGNQPNQKDITAEELSELLKVGLEDWTCNGVPKKGLKLLLTETFQADDASPQFLDEKFAFVTTMRAYYEQHVPRLTLGTIVKKIADGSSSYWVCIQPVCDCVRLDAIRAFPFLPLRIAEDNSKFEIVLREEDEYVRLLFSKRPYDLRLIRFRPRKCDNGVIVARKQGEAYYFQDTSRRQHKWMGELRREHAQRLSNEFAAALCRVGLDESEWLRLRAMRG